MDPSLAFQMYTPALKATAMWFRLNKDKGHNYRYIWYYGLEINLLVLPRPVHQVQVEVVEHVRGVQYLLGSRGHLATVDGLGGRRFPGRVKNLLYL